MPEYEITSQRTETLGSIRTDRRYDDMIDKASATLYLIEAIEQLTKAAERQAYAMEQFTAYATGKPLGGAKNAD